MADFDVTVVGAGAVGLACGAVLAKSGLSVLVLEAETAIASMTSSRNSEVIHAGFYYPKDSLKHLLCCRGRQLLYKFVNDYRIPFRKCGKLVVAADHTELPAIEGLYQRALENGVENIRFLTAKEMIALEPDVRAVGGLFSQETGIFDSHAYFLALQAIVEENGGIIALQTPFLSAEVCKGGFRIHVGGLEPTKISSRFLLNSAGLCAEKVATAIDALQAGSYPRLYYAKGSYFSLRGRAPFSHLVYPAPVEGGLGVHATLDLAGQIRFGPDVEWLDAVSGNCPVFDYRVDIKRSDIFYAAIRKYWPGLKDGALVPDYSGIRPKLNFKGEKAADFTFHDETQHRISGLVNLFGIESPGLTSSLAIAEEVAKRVK